MKLSLQNKSVNKWKDFPKYYCNLGVFSYILAGLLCLSFVSHEAFAEPAQVPAIPAQALSGQAQAVTLAPATPVQTAPVQTAPVVSAQTPATPVQAKVKAAKPAPATPVQAQVKAETPAPVAGQSPATVSPAATRTTTTVTGGATSSVAVPITPVAKTPQVKAKPKAKKYKPKATSRPFVAAPPPPLHIAPYQDLPPASANRSSYGLTPGAPSLERNMYLDTVWTSLVPRRQLYTDPALKVHKSRRGRVVAVPKKQVVIPKNVLATPQNAQANKPAAELINIPKTPNPNAVQKNTGMDGVGRQSQFTNQGGNGTGQQSQGTNQGMTTNGQQISGALSDNNTLNNSGTPFASDIAQNSEIPQVQMPIPGGLPATAVSVEPNLVLN